MFKSKSKGKKEKEKSTPARTPSKKKMAVPSTGEETPKSGAKEHAEKKKSDSTENTSVAATDAASVSASDEISEKKSKSSSSGDAAASSSKSAGPTSASSSSASSSVGGGSTSRSKRSGHSSSSSSSHHSMKDVTMEVAELDAYKVASDAETSPHDYLPTKVYEAYDQIQNFARDLNTQIEAPEIVLIGAQGHGKSSVLEAFLGFPINMVGNGGCTKRPVIFNLNNNVDYEQPKVILKRDSILTDFDQDVVVKLTDLPAQLKKRNVATEGPVFVQFEYKHALNLQLIDMPGLIDENQGDLMADEIRMAVEEWITPPHRIILAVEQCQSADKLRLQQLIKPFDPDFARTVFALTHFNDHVRRFTSARDLNRFLQQNTHELKRFFVTLPSLAVRSRFTEVRPFQQKLWQYVQRDLDDLEKLAYNKTYADRVGIVALRKHLLHQTWYRYKAVVPRILAQLRAKRAQTQRDIATVAAELEGLGSSRLRALASKYVVDFLQVIEQLLSGTSEGNVSVHGQTLADEKADHGDAEWYTSSGGAVPVEAGSDKWDIPYWSNRLYGGQQFERLLREFKAVAAHAEFPDISVDDQATAAGMGKLSNAPDHAWAATDLAQQKAREVLNPLIEQLASRASHLFKRLVSIAQRIMESRQQAKEGQQVSNVDDITQYTYFTYHVQNLYDEFVDQVAKQALNKCMDEFYAPRTIYWEITKLEQRTFDSGSGDEGTVVTDMAKSIFLDVRDRIAGNVVLKFYNFFLVPMQTDLWKVVQGDITHMSDDQLEQKFSLQTTIQNLENDRNNLEDTLLELDDQELLFGKAAKEFGQL